MTSGSSQVLSTLIRYRKPLFYALLAFVGVYLLIKIVPAVQRSMARARLMGQIEKVEPWTTSTNYSRDGWKQLVRTAQTYQKLDSRLAETVLVNYVQQHEGKPAELDTAKATVFLLLRTVYALPEDSRQRAVAGGWERGISDLNDDDTFNEAWPLVWNAGNPRLASGRQGAAGNYSVKADAAYLRFRYKERDLSSFKP